MICARCDKPIKGKPEEVTVETGTGAAGPVYICPVPCRPVPRQTAPRQ